MVFECFIHHIAHRTGIAKIFIPTIVKEGQVTFEVFLGIGSWNESTLIQHVHRNLQQLIGHVIFKAQHFVKTAVQTRVGLEESFHVVGVTRHKHKKLSPHVFHPFQEGLDGFITKVAVCTARFGGKGIRFVNEEHTTQGFFDLLVGFDRGLAHKTRYQSLAVGFDHMAAFEHAQCLVNFGQNPCHGRFARAGIPNQHRMEEETIEHIFARFSVKTHKADHLMDLGLDFIHTNHAVQLVYRFAQQHLIDGDIGQRAQVFEVNLGNVGQFEHFQVFT